MLGNNIKELRKSKRMTQRDLAEAMNVSQQTVGAWETERAIPGADTLSELADYFNVTTDYLLGREVKQPANNNRNEKADLVAAHIDDDVSESDMKQITDFIDFLKSKQ